jgi:hypothetical protein
LSSFLRQGSLNCRKVQPNFIDYFCDKAPHVRMIAKTRLAFTKLLKILLRLKL